MHQPINLKCSVFPIELKTIKTVKLPMFVYFLVDNLQHIYTCTSCGYVLVQHLKDIDLIKTSVIILTFFIYFHLIIQH